MSKKFKDELQNMYVEMLSKGSKAPGDVDAGKSFVDSEADVSGKGYKVCFPDHSDQFCHSSAEKPLATRGYQNELADG